MKVKEALELLGKMPLDAELIHASSESDLNEFSKDVPVRAMKHFSSGLKGKFMDRQKTLHDVYEIVGGHESVVHIL